MNILKKIDKWNIKLQEFAISSSVISMSLILIGNVISRKFFGRSWEFAEELGQILVVIITFIGTSYAVKKGKHIRMSAVFDIMPNHLKRVCTLIITLISSISMTFLFLLSINYFIDVFQSGRVTPVLKIPITFTVAFVCMGFMLSAIEFFAIFLMNIKHKKVLLSIDELKERGE